MDVDEFGKTMRISRGSLTDERKHGFVQTIRLGPSRAHSGEYEEAPPDAELTNVVVEHCPGCHALLDVSACSPLDEAECPVCATVLVVLRHFHHFQLLSYFGRGGMGVVYRAFDEGLHREVALKLLRNEYTANPQYIAQLEEEAHRTASVSHANVVKVYSTGAYNGFYFIAMEVVPGGTLASRIGSMGMLDERLVLRVGIQVAEGLNAAYARGLLHRDVKPGNILFTNEGTVKVVDFGLALPAGIGTEQQDVWGTPYYMAPERLEQKPETLQSEIYSLGATLYHALAGRPPFEADTANGVVQKHLTGRLVPVQTFAPNVSNVTAAILNQMLQKDPSARQASYSELLRQLQYALSAISAVPVPTHQRVRQHSLRETRLQGLRQLWFSIACIVLIAIVGIYTIVRTFSSKPTAPKASGPKASEGLAQVHG